MYLLALDQLHSAAYVIIFLFLFFDWGWHTQYSVDEINLDAYFCGYK